MSKRYGNVSGVPLSLAVFLATDNYDHNPDPNTISVTTLLKPVRQIILATRVPQENTTVDLVAQMSNRLGSAMHDAIERSWKDNYAIAMLALGYPQRVIDRIRINPVVVEPDTIPIYMEQRMSKKVGKWTVTGKFDFIGEGRVQDFKSASVWSYREQTNAHKQIMQGSMYRWLDPVKITDTQMDIIHIFMDWRRAQARTDPNYPPQHFAQQTFNLLDINRTDAYVKQKLADIDRYMDADEKEIPQCEDEDLWRSDAKFKYYKNGNSNASRSTKNFDSMLDAQTFMYGEGKGAGIIKEVPGEVRACRYCPAFAACTQKDQLIATGHLTMNPLP